MRCPEQIRSTGIPLYSIEERYRRDQSIWTTIQAVLAPLQFLIFLVSAALIVRYVITAQDLYLAEGSVVIKTLALYLIMATGSIWEKEVFGVYLFAPAFFWEDVFSIVVLALHTAYLVIWYDGKSTPATLIWIATAAYCAYLVNAAQFVWKFRSARQSHSNTAISNGVVIS
jgi:3-vinyl bacteriochlorophyllide hydratase